MRSKTKFPESSRVHRWHWHGLVFVTMLLLIGCSGSTAIKSPTPTPTISVDATSTPGSTDSGSPWAQLESKPLHLPSVAGGASCPVTPGQAVTGSGTSVAYGAGPAYVTVGESNGVLHYDPSPSLDNGSPWGLSQIHWAVAPAYSGPLLIRGSQIDGAHTVGFNGGEGFSASNPTGTEPVQNELRLQVTQPGGNQWYLAVSYVRVQAPGCYAYQFDGTSFSEVVVFQAVAQ